MNKKIKCFNELNIYQNTHIDFFPLNTNKHQIYFKIDSFVPQLKSSVHITACNFHQSVLTTLPAPVKLLVAYSCLLYLLSVLNKVT